MPPEVDEMLLEHSSGWLLEQMALLDGNPAQEWWKQPTGFYDDDQEFPGAAAPPAGYERLPMHEEG